MSFIGKQLRDVRVAFEMMLEGVVRELKTPTPPTENINFREVYLNNLYRFLDNVQHDVYSRSYYSRFPDDLEYGYEDLIPAVEKHIPEGFTRNDFIDKVQADLRILAVDSPFTVEQSDIDIIINFVDDVAKELKSVRQS